jgi:hypothetical protein
MADIEEAERWIERIKDDVEATKLRRSITKLEENRGKDRASLKSGTY